MIALSLGFGSLVGRFQLHLPFQRTAPRFSSQKGISATREKWLDLCAS